MIMSESKLEIKTKRARGEDGHKTFSIRISEKTCERLEALADKTGHSRNELIGLMLDYALENYVVVE